MLELINEARRAAGLVEVVLDDNPTAQLHAEDMRANCFGGHWGSDGKKPYMRYTLNGGTHNSAENASGSSYCPPDPSRYAYAPLYGRVARAHEGLMNSPDHRDNLLRAGHRKVGLGFAYQRPNLWVAQLFTSDHIEYVQLPSIEEGVLTFGYRLTNGATDLEFPAYVHFDPPPHDLARGQLMRTYCYSSGQRIAGILPQLSGGRSWAEDNFVTKLSGCADPYAVAPDASVPTGYEDPLFSFQPTAVPDGERASTVAEWITSEVLPLDGGGYSVRSDISHLVAHYGPGVYTLIMFAVVDGESVQVSEYSIFVQ